MIFVHIVRNIVGFSRSSLVVDLEETCSLVHVMKKISSCQ